MRMIVKKMIGNTEYEFQVDGENFFDVVMKSQQLSFRDVHKCGLCTSENLYITAYITKEDKYEYIKIVCAKCKASLTFGKRKDVKDTYYLRRNETGYDWKKFEEKKTESSSEAPF